MINLKSCVEFLFVSKHTRSYFLWVFLNAWVHSKSKTTASNPDQVHAVPESTILLSARDHSALKWCNKSVTEIETTAAYQLSRQLMSNEIKVKRLFKTGVTRCIKVGNFLCFIIFLLRITEQKVQFHPLKTQMKYWPIHGMWYANRPISIY